MGAIAHLSTPEEILSEPKGPPLRFELRCNKCGDSAVHEFPYAVINPEIREHRAEGWDGVLLPRIVECSRCGAVDDYALGHRSYMTLIAEILEVLSSDESGFRSTNGRVMLGISKLWDGTVARRASQVLAHLKKLTEEQPRNGEAWRRLGNAEERFGKLDSAERSWRKALEVDPNELESAFSLAQQVGNSERWPEAFGFLRAAIQRLPKSRHIDSEPRLNLSQAIVGQLRRILAVTDEPFALMAGWAGNHSKAGSVVHVSSVDVRKIEHWNHLSAFLVSPGVMVADLTTDMPETNPTQLQLLLADDWSKVTGDGVRSRSPSPVVNERKPVGRNAPCPCGSGKKHKKCCGR